MRKPLFISALAALLLTGCGTAKSPDAAADLPIRYHNSQYDFTFFLPADWRGYTVLTQQWEGDASAVVKQVNGPLLVIRHPQWSVAAPRQDIPIKVFTRSQWDAVQQGWNTAGAGGIEDEIEHNNKYVFAIHSRFTWAEAEGSEEAGKIVQQNWTLNGPRLYPQ